MLKEAAWHYTIGFIRRAATEVKIKVRQVKGQVVMMKVLRAYLQSLWFDLRSDGQVRNSLYYSQSIGQALFLAIFHLDSDCGRSSEYRLCECGSPLQQCLV